MFNDRDIAVIGAGALASVLCLLLPVPFPWKVGIGFTVLVIALVAALIRLGRDRLTPEEYLVRRIRYWLRPRFWTFQVRDLPLRFSGREAPGQKIAEPPPPAPERPVKRKPEPEPAAHRLPGVRRVSAAVSWRLDPALAERIAGLLLAVVGLYFLDWLRTGGAVALGMDLARVLP
ncbi:MAG TPA: hypothetical protein VMN57_01455 [Anaerolineales bacterium]|nr:hypothetical protein [Anaerolineales bacterium]